MSLRTALFASIALASVLACSGKPPEPAEAPAAPSASAGSPETAAATQAAELAPSASAPAPGASAAPESASAEPPKEEPPKGTETKTSGKAGAASKSSDKSTGQTQEAGYTGDDPCQTKNFHYGAVKAACHSGGRPAAKGIMKGAVQKAKAAGQDVRCTSCHEDTKSFALKSNAVADLKQWL